MKLDQELIKSYLETDYLILPIDLVVNIGKENKRLSYEMSNSNWENFAIVTAWNPFSDILLHEENLIRNLKLLKELIEADYFIYPAMGKSKDNCWKPEESWCIFNITKEDAIAFGKKYDQNAIVYGKIYSEPSLVYCVNPI